MKAIIFLFMVLVAMTSTAEVLKGKLSSEKGFVLNSDLDSVHFAPGSRTFRLETEFNFIQKDKIVFILDGNKKMSVSAPSKFVSKLRDRETFKVSSAEMKQDFGLKALNVSKLINVTRAIKTESCTYCGYCYAVDFSSGQMKYDYHTDCSGNRKFLQEARDYRVIYNIDFLDKNDRVMANYSSDPFITTEYKEVEETQPCN